LQVLPCASAKIPQRGLLPAAIPCGRFPFAVEGVVKEEEMGYCLPVASVNLGERWAQLPAGVGATALDVSRSVLEELQI